MLWFQGARQVSLAARLPEHPQVSSHQEVDGCVTDDAKREYVLRLSEPVGIIQERGEDWTDRLADAVRNDEDSRDKVVKLLSIVV